MILLFHIVLKGNKVNNKKKKLLQKLFFCLMKHNKFRCSICHILLSSLSNVLVYGGAKEGIQRVSGTEVKGRYAIPLAGPDHSETCQIRVNFSAYNTDGK